MENKIIIEVNKVEKRNMKNILEKTVINLCNSVNSKTDKLAYSELIEMVRAISELISAIANLED